MELIHPKPFIYIGFYLITLIDEGHTLTIEEVKDKIEAKTLFNWLKSKFEDFDVSFLDQKSIHEIETYFLGLTDHTDEGRKFGVSNNGLCLLMAYCLNGAKANPTDYDSLTKLYS